MQNELLDILIIGCLVVIFTAIYRKRATFRFRCWTVGWIFILIHFAAQLHTPNLPLAQEILEVISLGGLIACGVLFLLPTGNKAEERTWRNLAVPLLPAFTSITITVLVTYGVQKTWPYYLCIAGGEFGAIVYALRFHRERRRTVGLLLTSVLAGAIWLCWTVANGREDIALSAILFQMYVSAAIVYLDEFRRISAGMLTVSVGLFAWAAVFPVGEFCDHLRLQSISPELWNIPKYFVAFGMILVLLEDEIRAASSASRNYRLLFEANPHPMWIYNRSTLAFESVNDAAVRHYGYSREEFLAMTLADIRPTEEFERVVREQQELEPNQQLTGPWRHQRKDGSYIQVDVASSWLDNGTGPLAFSLMQDVTERQRLHEQLVYQANHDTLTGLPNRAFLAHRMRQTLTHAERHSRKAAMLCIDLDRFKQINDTFGHSAGDDCLKEIGKRLNSRVRSMDTVARAGGEEFSVLLHEIESTEDAKRVAEDLLAAIKQPIASEGYSLELTASIGIAVYPLDGQDAEILWRNADCAMYRAKNSGGNQFLCMSPEMSMSAHETNELELLIRRAVKEGQLELQYQPIFDLDGELNGLEALLRLPHSTLGAVPPDRFISLAEEIGLIIPIGNWVLEEVCRQISVWRQEGLSLPNVALNVSPLQLSRFDFASHLVEVISRYHISPQFLGVELTETAMMRNMRDASRQIEALARLGVEFSVDDFGTGYSSLAHLHQLPVQRLKIDKSFIERIAEPNGTFSIVQAIIFLAHSLNMKVIAEGVEREEQLTCLRRLECDLVQGFHFSYPLHAKDVAELLSTGRRKGPQLVCMNPEPMIIPQLAAR